MPLYSLDEHAPTTPQNGDFWVAPDADVIGQVVIGEAVGIWFGAVLRGDNEPITIGNGSNVQEHTMIHTDPGF
ncbi:MAG: gamma carbonic anhydrase family protein, partial [Rhizobiales bacterium]|nr:gamma carbonic anhydrase family protein [Hyphomicrobiales bacterium]